MKTTARSYKVGVRVRTNERRGGPLIEVKAELMGSVWKIVAAVGDAVELDDQIMILESMKMEIPVLAPSAGTLTAILVSEGDTVEEGQALADVES
jgi:acetyl-CoA carboxylase biotin carboxyl carrier protein